MQQLIELLTIHDMKNFNGNFSLGSNSLQLPLHRGRDELAPPLLRGGREGFKSVAAYGKTKIKRIKPC
jgi:hypothetical protein